MEQPWENFDNVILASPMLKSRRINDNGTTIELIYTDFPDAGADSALQCCHNALKFFRRLYKIAGDEDIYMKFLLSASGTSGGYSRKNFIMLSSRTFNEYVLKNTAHEIGHFWWNKAPVESWHDWLNESFAEFSALQYIRHALSVLSGVLTATTAKRILPSIGKGQYYSPTCLSGWVKNLSSTFWQVSSKPI